VVTQQLETCTVLAFGPTLYDVEAELTDGDAWLVAARAIEATCVAIEARERLLAMHRQAEAASGPRHISEFPTRAGPTSEVEATKVVTAEPTLADSRSFPDVDVVRDRDASKVAPSVIPRSGRGRIKRGYRRPSSAERRLRPTEVTAASVQLAEAPPASAGGAARGETTAIDPARPARPWTKTIAIVLLGLVALVAGIVLGR